MQSPRAVRLAVALLGALSSFPGSSGIITVAAMLFGSAPPAEAQALSATQTDPEMIVRFSDFAESGSTPEVLRKLVRRLWTCPRIPAVFGFENAGVWQEKVFLAANEDDVPSLIRKLRQQDPRLRLTETGNPSVVNLLASDAGLQGRAILEFRMSKFDIEVDAAPDELVFRLARYSKELDEYLSKVFAAGGGSPGGGAVITGIGNAKLPHFSIHRKDITVREALNAIAAESYRKYAAHGYRDPRLGSDHDEPMFGPTGWEFHYVPPAGMGYEQWIWTIFRPLQ